VKPAEPAEGNMTWANQVVSVGKRSWRSRGKKPLNRVRSEWRLKALGNQEKVGCIEARKDRIASLEAKTVVLLTREKGAERRDCGEVDAEERAQGHNSLHYGGK
jgi:hypothetical protein